MTVPAADPTVEQVEALLDFCDMMVTQNCERRDRAALAERLVTLAADGEVRRDLTELVTAARASFPGHTIGCSILGRDKLHRLTSQDVRMVVADVQPAAESYCRFGVASGRRFEVTDSLGRDALLVCTSPHAAEGRSYIGSPIVVLGQPVGMFCAYSSDPRDAWEADTEGVIDGLALQASDILDAALRAAA